MTTDSNPTADEPPGQPGQNNNGKSELTIYLYNVVEDEWNFINALSDQIKLLEEIERDEATSDCFYLSTATQSHFAYISPKPISSEFQAYAQKLFKFKHGQIFNPQMKTHQLCLDLMADKSTFNQLIALAQTYQKISLISYAATPQFYQLKNELVKQGLNLSTPEAPVIDYAWTVNFFGSKSGIRQLAQKSVAEEPDFVMPDGIICVGKYDAAKIAANKYIKNQGVVLKTNKGCGGNGVLIFRDKDLPYHYTSCERKISQILSQENYWEKFPIVVEDLINVNFKSLTCFPNLEFKIKKNGNIDLFFTCITKVTPTGEFYGQDINDDILNDRLDTRITDTGYYIAEQYAAAGYRGRFDIDFIFSKGGQIFVSESNTRNTGGTDIALISQKLIGKDFVEDAYTLNRSRLKIAKSKLCVFDNLINHLKPLLYSHQTKQGLIINSENNLSEKELIYTIIAPDKKQAYRLESQMFALLQNGNNKH